jgi:hypothetical protein
MPSLVYASGIGGGAVTREGAKNNLFISFSVLLIGFLVLSLIKKIKVKFFIINMMLTAIKILGSLWKAGT